MQCANHLFKFFADAVGGALYYPVNPVVPFLVTKDRCILSVVR